VSAVELSEKLSDNGYRRELGGGLVLRWSTLADVEGVAALYSEAFRIKREDPPNPHVAVWTRDMFSGRHPHITPYDFAVVDDTERGVIVAATCLISYTCTYDGIPFAFGRPEVVASLPEYRRQGLIRAIFALIHARSAAQGHLVQGITGIPYYYRQFGYEYALNLGGRRLVYFAAIPRLKPDQTELYTLRDASEEDLPRIMALHEHEHVSSLVTARVDVTYWHWLLCGMNREALEGWHVQLICGPDGLPVGYTLSWRFRWDVALNVGGLAIEPGVSLVAALPSVLRALQVQAETIRVPRPDTPPAGALGLVLGSGHPAYDALGEIQTAEVKPYAWYLRVPDLPAFLHHIAPALERRLAGSAAAGYSGEVTLDFYRGGLRLVFEQGRLTTAEDWNMPLWGKAQAGFPPLVFLQLLFGYRSLDELRYAYPDVWTEDEAGPLLQALFPKQPSHLHPLD
jgi:hypothetical protein